MGLSLPPPLDARDPRSFARLTLVERVPRLVSGLLRTAPLSAAARIRLGEAVARPLQLTVRRLPLPPEEAERWEEFFAASEGSRLSDLPFFQWEAYLYAWLLLETGYYQTGSDPFAAAKRQDFAASLPALEEASRAALLSDRGPAGPALRAAVERSLLANLADASNPEMQARGAGRTVLLHQEPWPEVEALLRAGPRVRILADNAMSELWYDLLLARALVRAAPSTAIELAVKRHPMFVSDATSADLDLLFELVDEAPGAASLGRAAADVRSLLGRGRVEVRAFPELNAPYDLSAPALAPIVAPEVVLVVKGDANFRRALEDRAWPPTTPLELACRAPLRRALFLRVLKSECVAGLAAAAVARAEREDPAWRTDGRHATVQLLRRAEGPAAERAGSSPPARRRGRAGRRPGDQLRPSPSAVLSSQPPPRAR